MFANIVTISVLTSPNSTELTKLALNNHTSICLCMVFAMASKVRKKGKNFKINRESGRILKKSLKAEKIFRFIGRLGRSESLDCTLECLINVPVRVFISRKMPPYTGLI